jgi:hypothetical protein
MIRARKRGNSNWWRAGIRKQSRAKRVPRGHCLLLVFVASNEKRAITPDETLSKRFKIELFAWMMGVIYNPTH